MKKTSENVDFIARESSIESLVALGLLETPQGTNLQISRLNLQLKVSL
jgi:hypothetical protein